MRAAVVKDFTQPLEITQVSTPEPGPGEVLVRIEASGLGRRPVWTRARAAALIPLTDPGH